jgi:hypothetical protein
VADSPQATHAHVQTGIRSNPLSLRPSWRRILHLLWLIPLLIALLVILGIGASLLYFDLTTFRPRLPHIMKIVEYQRMATPVIPSFLSRCLDHEACDDLYISRCLLMEFGLNQTTSKRWHARHAGWTMLVKWHLKKEERQLLYCHFISDQSGHLGIHHVSQKLYQKPLTALNERELASLVIVSRAPGIFLRDKTKLDLATTRFMAELP